ncbi:Lecithin:cholesterol acyltransferase family protein [Tritrichomonas foetus]|uniref:Lecithin:cholesterol acyltransferase family protein n=1 Tax=Tritrichomonas foetus TaxID=1144522 RepID=A0A1J4JFS3_9EUKA|nr:Lecithin:cholesterol acyltransferase family protein [Tritrichomonas foetus]|eukprot:OHS96076.1 Lecithin:cholesterol acyltransferase family protein [Tritrichomonas foetus]
MFFVLSYLSLSLKPILLIPGHGGTNVRATLTNPSLHPECPADLINNFEFWPPNSTFVTEHADCMGKLLRCVYDKKSNTINHIDGIKFDVNEFGDLTTLPFYTKLVNFLVKEKGYTVSKNIFGLPYDWILYYAGLPPTFFDDIKNFIQNISVNNHNKPVVIAGHSLGTHVIRMFLNSPFVDKNWIEKYIDSIVFIAPAFSGCFSSFDMVVRGAFSTLPYNEVTRPSVYQMPSLHVLFQNYEVYENEPIFEINDTFSVKANGAIDFLLENDKMNEEGYFIFKNFVEESSLKHKFYEPKDYSLKTFTLLNSGIKTHVGYNVDDNYSRVYGNGDGMCAAKGMNLTCLDNWKNAECYDFNVDNEDEFGHATMVDAHELHVRFWDFVTEQSSPKTNNAWLLAGFIIAIVVIVIISGIIFYFIYKKKNNGFTQMK